MDCLFCKIAAGEIPCNKVYEDDRILAFHDISPQAPVHVLVIPKEHIGGIDEITQDNIGAVSCVLQEIPQIAGQLGLAGGYRVISNSTFWAANSFRTKCPESSEEQNK